MKRKERMYKEIELKNKEKLLIPIKIRKKLKRIFEKILKIKQIKEKKKYFILISKTKITKKEKKGIYKYKIVENIKGNEIYIKKHTISYFKDYLNEMYNINPKFEYCHKLKKNIKLKKHSNPKYKKQKIETGEIIEIKNFLTKKEIKQLKKQIKKQSKGKVPTNGKFHSLKEKEKIGAERSYIFSKRFSKKIKKRIKGIIEKEIIVNRKNDSIDYLGYKNWKLKKVNPLLRIIEYKKYGKKYGGRLIPHYDYPYDKNNKERSLKTIVIYLTTNKSGATRFLKDNIKKARKEKSIYKKDYKDKDYIPKKNKIIKEVFPEKGKAIVFDHRMLHDAGEITYKEKKIIIFMDIIYERK
jgi:hypothetical protein